MESRLSNNPLAAKLQQFSALPDTDIAVLDGLCADVRLLRAKQDLIKEGDQPENLFLLVEGWACRYKILPDGQRQIMAYLVPGDLCDVHILILKKMDHSIGLISNAKVAAIPKHKMLQVLDERPDVTRALWWSSLTDEAVLREWIVNIGQREAYERVAHLFVELWFRLNSVGLVQDSSIDLPLTQADIADTLGLTPVHVNRVIQRLRANGLVHLAKGRLCIPDLEKMIATSQFEANYLHLDNVI